MKDRIIFIERQLLGGYIHAGRDYNLISHITKIGFTSEEWDALKTVFSLPYLSKDEIKEIDEYFRR